VPTGFVDRPGVAPPDCSSISLTSRRRGQPCLMR